MSRSGTASTVIPLPGSSGKRSRRHELAGHDAALQERVVLADPGVLEHRLPLGDRRPRVWSRTNQMRGDADSDMTASVPRILDPMAETDTDVDVPRVVTATARSRPAAADDLRAHRRPRAAAALGRQRQPRRGRRRPTGPGGRRRVRHDDHQGRDPGEPGRRVRGGPAAGLAAVRTGGAAARPPLAVGAGAAGRHAYARHPHLRLVRAHRREAVRAGPMDDRRSGCRPRSTGSPRSPRTT